MNNHKSFSVFNHRGSVFFHEGNFVTGFIRGEVTQLSLLFNKPQYVQEVSVSAFIEEIFNADLDALSMRITDIFDEYFEDTSCIEKAYSAFEKAIGNTCKLFSSYAPDWFVQEYCLEYARRNRWKFTDLVLLIEKFIKDENAFLEEFQSKICTVSDIYTISKESDPDIFNTILSHNPIDELKTCISYTIKVCEYHYLYEKNLSKFDAYDILSLYTAMYNSDEITNIFESYYPQLLKSRTHVTLARAICDFTTHDDDTCLLDTIKKMEKTVPKEEFSAYFESIYHLFFIALYLCISDNIYIKTCKNCGKYFVPKNKNAVYCRFIPEKEGSKPCNKIGASRQFAKSMPEITKKYRALENRINNAIQRAPYDYKKTSLIAKKALFIEKWQDIKKSNKPENVKIKEVEIEYNKLFPKR